MDWLTFTMGVGAAALLFLGAKWLEKKQKIKLATKGSEIHEIEEED